jgi:hypothetical protein
VTTRTFTFPVTAPPNGGAFVTAVNSIPVGWTEFTGSTFPTYGGFSFFREPGGNGNEAGWILDYSQIGYRDATRGKIYHIGAAYNNRCYLCVFDEVTGAWSRTTLTPALAAPGITHTWDQLAYDPTRGLLYFFDPAAMNGWSCNVDTAALVAIPGGPMLESAETANVRYFATSDKLVAYRGRSAGGPAPIKTMPGGGSAWSALGAGDSSPPDRGGLSSYDHVNNELYVCGGLSAPTSLRKVSAAGAVTLLSPSGGPQAFTATSVMLPDPQTGLPVVFMYGGAVQAWTGSAWSSISTYPAAMGGSGQFGVSLTGFSGRSVFMFVNYANTVYLYRRS